MNDNSSFPPVPGLRRGRLQGESSDFSVLDSGLRRNDVNKDHFEIHTVETCESTQILAKKLAEEGAQDRTLILAREQTHAYGRQGRPWHSPRGGLWWSLILRPRLPLKATSDLSAVAALGILQGIVKSTGAPCRLKEPNDILLEGKKLAGVIVETGLKGSSLEWVVIGAGINVNNPLPPELESTAITLSQWKGEELALDPLLSSILAGFFDVYDVFEKKGFEGLKPEFPS